MFNGSNNLRVIIAEDDRGNQTYLRHLFAYHHFDITITSNGRELLKKLPEKDYNCVILDINMPVMDGIQTARQIRLIEEGTNRHIQLVALTASANTEDQDYLLSQGFDYYLTKPLKEADLLKLLQNIPILQPKNTPRYEMIDRKVFFSEAAIVSREIMLEIIDRFFNNHQQYLDRIAADLDSQDWGRLAKSAHMIAGAVANFYATPVLKAAQALEGQAVKKDEEGASVLVHTLESLVRKLIKELDALKEELKVGSENFQKITD